MQRQMTKMALFAVLVFTFGTGCGQSNENDIKPAAVNVSQTVKAPMAFDEKPTVGTKALCPVMKNEFVVSETTEFSEHESKLYAFCCPGCKPQFDADPKKFIGG